MTFETWDPSAIWLEWCPDKKTERQIDKKKDKKEGLILWCQGSFALLWCLYSLYIFALISPTFLVYQYKSSILISQALLNKPLPPQPPHHQDTFLLTIPAWWRHTTGRERLALCQHGEISIGFFYFFCVTFSSPCASIIFFHTFPVPFTLPMFPNSLPWCFLVSAFSSFVLNFFFPVPFLPTFLRSYSYCSQFFPYQLKNSSS